MKSDSSVQTIGIASFPKKINYFFVEAFCLIFLINLPNYLYLTKIWDVGPKNIFFIGLLFLLFIPRHFPSLLPLWPFFAWHVSLLAVAMFSWFFHYAFDWATSGMLRLTGGCFITFMAVVIGIMLPPTRLMRVICFATVITSLICCVDLIFPSVLEKGEIRYWGRAGGLFLNANAAGAAIALGFLVSCTWLDRKWFYLFFFISVLGLIATVSRSAALCFLGALIFIRFPGRVFSRRLIVMSLLIITILTGAVFYSIYDNSLEDGEALDWWLELAGGRVFGLNSDFLDYSAMERFMALKRAWNAFTDFPLFGAGVGYTRISDEIASTHNMYATFAAELGTIGLLFLGFYFFASYYSIRNSLFRGNGKVALVFLALYFAFTHNHFDDYFPLLILGTIIGASLHFASHSKVKSVFGIASGAHVGSSHRKDDSSRATP